MNHSNELKATVKSKSKKEARDVRAEALKIANSQHVEGQSREHTRLIAAGIQGGMEQFLRQQSEKARELDKRVKKAKRLVENRPHTAESNEPIDAPAARSKPGLPWVLLAASWVFFLGYLVFSRV